MLFLAALNVLTAYWLFDLGSPHWQRGKLNFLLFTWIAVLTTLAGICMSSFLAWGVWTIAVELTPVDNRATYHAVRAVWRQLNDFVYGDDCD